MDCKKHNIPLRKRVLSEVGIDKKGISRPLWYCDLCEKEEEQKRKNEEIKKSLDEDKEKVSCSVYATMSVEELAKTDFTMFPTVHRIEGEPDPKNASILEGWISIKNLLSYIQQRGVRPGTKLQITIEEI